MDMETAVNFVEQNIGECITIHKIGHNHYMAIAYREHAPFENLKYSTHTVIETGCVSGVYEMSEEKAWNNFIERICK
jgi:hypothetical protein